MSSFLLGVLGGSGPGGVGPGVWGLFSRFWLLSASAAFSESLSSHYSFDYLRLLAFI